MRIIAVLAGLMGFFCMALGIATLCGLLPSGVSDNVTLSDNITTVTQVGVFPGRFTWNVWFWLSALLLLISIACKSGRRGGGEEY